MKKKIKVESETTAEVGFHKDNADNGYKMSVVLTVRLKGIRNVEAKALVEAAHQFCPFSKAIKGNVDVAVKHELV